MKILVFTCLLSLVMLSAAAQTKVDSVWICTGHSSYAYHNTTMCKGLRNCRAVLKRVSLTDASKVYHRTPCWYCYQKRRRIHRSAGFNDRAPLN